MTLAKPRRCRLTAGGFTLLELLIASAMFAVIVGALYSAFYGALRLREKAYETLEKGLPKRYAVSLIQRDLAYIAAPVGLLAGPMIGEKTEEGDLRLDLLEIHTASGMVHDDEPWGDIQRIKYSVEEDPLDDNQGKHLVRAVTRNLLPSIEEEPEEERLLRHVQSLEFSYYDGEEWQDSWDSTARENELPEAIRLRIEYAPPEGDERIEPPIELVVSSTLRPGSAEPSEGQTSSPNRGQ
jgi:type II secretion system protein J